jgi:hypothetical protein
LQSADVGQDLIGLPQDCRPHRAPDRTGEGGDPCTSQPAVVLGSPAPPRRPQPPPGAQDLAGLLWAAAPRVVPALDVAEDRHSRLLASFQ